jgi:hypothetical protein
MQAVQDAKHHTTKVYGFGPWLPDRMDSSVLPMMHCVRQLGWKRNLAKVQERSCKRYKMPNITQQRFMVSVHDYLTGWILACYRWCFACANWDERGILLRPAQKNLSEWKWPRKGHASGTRCQTHNKGLWFRSMTTWQDGF